MVADYMSYSGLCGMPLTDWLSPLVIIVRAQNTMTELNRSNSTVNILR